MATIEAIQYSIPTDEERAFYDENGYIVIKNAIEPIGLDRVRRAFERRETETLAEREEGTSARQVPKWLWQWTVRAYYSPGF